VGRVGANPKPRRQWTPLKRSLSGTAAPVALRALAAEVVKVDAPGPMGGAADGDLLGECVDRVAVARRR